MLGLSGSDNDLSIRGIKGITQQVLRVADECEVARQEEMSDSPVGLKVRMVVWF